MKKIAIAGIILLALWCNAIAQDITLADTLWLRKATHISYDVAAWDTVFVDIMRGSVQVERVFLSSNGKGRWSGHYIPSYDGNFVAEYNAVYSGDTIVEEEYFSVLDTVAFQGSAAGLTAQEIIDSLIAQGYLPAPGSGAFACTLEIRDSSLQAGISGVSIAVKNNAQTATLRAGITNGDGLVFFNLDSLGTGSSYKLWLSQLQYTFTFPETLDLRGDTTAVYYGTAFDYGDPPADSACAVIGQVFNTLVDSLSGVIVTFTLETPDDSLIVYNGAIFSKYEVADTTDATGRFRLDILPEGCFDRPYGMLYYKVKIAYPVDWGGKIVEYDSVSVPKETTVDADEILH